MVISSHGIFIRRHGYQHADVVAQHRVLYGVPAQQHAGRSQGAPAVFTVLEKIGQAGCFGLLVLSKNRFRLDTVKHLGAAYAHLYRQLLRALVPIHSS